MARAFVVVRRMTSMSAPPITEKGVPAQANFARPKVPYPRQRHLAASRQARAAPRGSRTSGPPATDSRLPRRRSYRSPTRRPHASTAPHPGISTVALLSCAERCTRRVTQCPAANLRAAARRRIRADRRGWRRHPAAALAAVMEVCQASSISIPPMTLHLPRRISPTARWGSDCRVLVAGDRRNHHAEGRATQQL
jgi:hypothetical protein